MSHLLSVSSQDASVVRLPWSSLLSNKAHEIWSKVSGRGYKGQGMIGADAARVRHGFASLTGQDFHTYNFPQVWVERRQIPRVLHQRVPRTNATIVDLGCGPGTSTDVLCHFADPTWTILGYDLTGHLVTEANRRATRGEFKNRDGVTIAPRFLCQNIADPLRVMTGDSTSTTPDTATDVLESESVDLAISGGVVGLYLQVEEAERLLVELRRVVKPSGHIALDVGPAIRSATLIRLATANGFVLVDRARSCLVEPRPKLVFRKLG